VGEEDDDRDPAAAACSGSSSSPSALAAEDRKEQEELWLHSVSDYARYFHRIFKRYRVPLEVCPFFPRAQPPSAASD
jgi:hypothetical protein